jgi:hypothetical protein
MATTYAADIRPLFRGQDLACMVPHGILLNQAAWMCEPAPQFGYEDHGNARLVQERLASGAMPPDAPWAADQLATYQRWMDDGFQP